MPIYEYRCSACSHELEALQKLSDAPLVTCPACGAATLVKKVSAAGFQLKGSGWYATDFRNAGKPAAKSPPATDAASANADAKPADTKSDTKSDAKSDASADTKSQGKADAKPAAAPAATPASSSSTGSKTD
jgi:putative FmdB family regulatory protein